MMASNADIFCLQETQRAYIKPEDFQVPIRNDLGHGQLIIARKGIRHKELGVLGWSTDIQHLVAVELLEQPVRNVINVYACNSTKKEQD